MSENTPERKQINFTVVPDDRDEYAPIYANFCAAAHTPFDVTLTFCQVRPLSDHDVRSAETEHIVRVPIKAKIVVPIPYVPNLIALLQEQLRAFSPPPPDQDVPKSTVQ